MRTPSPSLLMLAACLVGCAWDAPREARQGPLRADGGLPPLDLGPPVDPDRGPPPPQCDVDTTPLRADGGRFVGVGEVRGGAATLPVGCGADGVEAVFAFTPGEGGVWRFSSEGSAVPDTVVAVYAGCAADAALIACNDDTERGTQAVAEAAIQPGQTVYAAVTGFGGNFSGAVQLVASPADVPQPGDPCDLDQPQACGAELACWWDDDRLPACQAPRTRRLEERCAPDGRIGPCEANTQCLGDADQARCVAVGGDCPAGVVPGELEQFRTDDGRWVVPSADVQSGGVIEQCLSSEPRRHRVWRLLVTDGGRYVFETRAPARDRPIDTVLEVSTRCSAGRPLACDDDGGSSTFSRAVAELSAGMEVFVKVSAFGPGEIGGFSLLVSRR